MTDIKSMRIAADLAGDVVALACEIDRARYSRIERGYIRPSDAELTRITEEIKRLASAKTRINSLAAEIGWPVQAL